MASYQVYPYHSNGGRKDMWLVRRSNLSHIILSQLEGVNELH